MEDDHEEEVEDSDPPTMDQVAALCRRLNELGAKDAVDRLFLKQLLGDELPPTPPLAPL